MDSPKILEITAIIDPYGVFLVDLLFSFIDIL
jgi:hypothetical protein